MSRLVDFKPGLYQSLPPSVYHARVRGFVSKSALDLIARSPAHYKAWLDGADVEEEPTGALRFGSAFHCALLEPQRFETEYVCEPDFGDCRSTANKKRRDDWREAHANSTFISSTELATLKAMVASVKKHPLASKMITGGDAELTVRWDDEETGLPCKSRTDYYIRKLAMVADIKTTLNASPAAFRKDAVKYGYHIQHALYATGFAALNEPISHFCFVAVEKEPPYAVAVYKLDQEAVNRGEATARSLMRLLRDCHNHNTWPGYPVTIKEIDLPKWALETKETGT